MSDAIAGIWQAAGDPGLWVEAMRMVKPLMPECLGFVTFTPFAEGHGTIWQTLDPPSGFMDEYVARWLGRDTTLHMIARRLPVDRLIIDHDTTPELERCDVWQQLYVPHGIKDMSILVTHGATAEGTGALVFGSFCDRKTARKTMLRRQILANLAPHFDGAAKLHWRLAKAELQTASSKSILDRLSLGIVVLNAQGTALDMNRAAKRLFDRRDSLVFGHGKVGATEMKTQRLLEKSIAAVIAGGAERPLTITRESGRPLTIIIAPAAVDEVQLGSTPARAVIFISDPDLIPQHAGSRMASLYGLTASEAEIAELIASGKDISEIAAVRRTSLATVRSQLKAAMAKIGASRQSDVVRAVLTIGILDPR